MDVFSYTDYKTIVQDWMKSRPKGGHGLYKKMAEQLGISTVLVSQVFNGDRDLTTDQAWMLTEFLGLNSFQAEYFHLLVQRTRAGHHALKSHLTLKLDEIRKRAQNLKDRLPQDIELSSEDKARFYSGWHYSAIRLLSSLPGYSTPQQIAERLDLPQGQVIDALEFLLAKGLCIETEGKFSMGARRTHLEKSSPFIRARQVDWRLRGFDAMSTDDPDQIFFTAPLTVHKEGLAKIRTEILKLVDAVTATVREKEPTEIACLNIDWFKL